MSQQKVGVRIFFKSAEGPKAEPASYVFDQAEFDRLKGDFINFVTYSTPHGGAYKCEIQHHLAAHNSRSGRTEIVLSFSEVAYIG
ncbi:MAG TPA: hypothetical protein VEX70_12790 [Pyrinomonadaceae bacterium]|nr:hypothetical protein [Pyrinomonadaceae bacterium]